jgi:plastocyanin
VLFHLRIGSLAALLALGLAPLALPDARLEAQEGPRSARPAARPARTFTVALREERRNDAYLFVPAAVTLRPGDLLRFRVESGAPHSIVIRDEGLEPGVRQAWAGALRGRVGGLTGPLLTETGTTYEVTVPAAVPPGRYRFYCLVHRAFSMDGTLQVVAP